MFETTVSTTATRIMATTTFSSLRNWLLFVWSQSECTPIKRNSEKKDETTKPIDDDNGSDGRSGYNNIAFVKSVCQRFERNINCGRLTARCSSTILRKRIPLVKINAIHHPPLHGLREQLKNNHLREQQQQRGPSPPASSRPPSDQDNED